jgi:hypothetical protein
MGGGSTSQLCPHCGSELRPEARFCRTCGQSVLASETAPVPFPDLPAAQPGARPGAAATAPGTVPLNLPDGGVAPPAWSGAETVTASAVPAAPASGPSGWAPPPADEQATRYQPADQQPAGYQPPDYQSPDYPPPGHRSPSGGGSRRGRIIVAILAVIVAVGGIAAGLLIARAHANSGHQPSAGQSTPAGSSGPASAGSPGSVPPSSGAPSSASAPTEQQGATNLSALLAQSGSDRGAINSAYNDVMSCGSTLSQDQATFQQAATSRQSLLSRLATMPDASALPAGMTSSLTRAWQASITADQDYAAWAGDESASCTPNGSDANLTAAGGPDLQATTDKTAFVNSWNPIAQQYGLQTYAQDQI